MFILIKEDRGMFAENLKKIRKDKGYTQEIGKKRGGGGGRTEKGRKGSKK